MTNFESLEQLAYSYGVCVNQSILREEDALDGLYVALPDGSCLILINRHRTLAERTAALAEELGHHFKSIGDLRDTRDTAAAKSENLGRAWSYEQLLPFDILAHQIKSGHVNPWELADAVLVLLIAFCYLLGALRCGAFFSRLVLLFPSHADVFPMRNARVNVGLVFTNSVAVSYHYRR